MGPRTFAQSLLYDLSDPGIWNIPGGTFWIGSDRPYPEGKPAYRITVNSLWIDGAPIINREFRSPIVAKRYIAVAEKVLGLTDELHDRQCGPPHQQCNDWTAQFPAHFNLSPASPHVTSQTSDRFREVMP
jgi:formylglycine-generating enzyme required for sulfatase activity